MDEVLKAAEKLIASVEFDVNGINGKGGNGGLTSNQTLQYAGELRVLMGRFKIAHDKAIQELKKTFEGA